MLGNLIPRATNLFAGPAMKVAASIIVALVAAIGVLMWRADSLSNARDEALREAGRPKPATQSRARP